MINPDERELVIARIVEALQRNEKLWPAVDDAANRWRNLRDSAADDLWNYARKGAQLIDLDALYFSTLKISTSDFCDAVNKANKNLAARGVLIAALSRGDQTLAKIADEFLITLCEMILRGEVKINDAGKYYLDLPIGVLGY